MTQGEMDRPEDESERTEQGSTGMDGAAYYGPVSSPEERNWAMLVHLTALSGLVTSGVGSILGPLIVWLLFRARSDMVEYHGKRALNFQISFFIYGVVAAILMFVLIGFLLLPIVIVVWLIWTIVAAVRASRGDPPGYILSIGFLK